MSFILDALRKSETERQKAQVPGIGDAPLVVHQKHVPRWAVGLIAGLSVGLVVLGWFWLRDTGTGVDQDAANVTASSTQPDTGTATSTAQTIAGAAISSEPSASPETTSAPASQPVGEVRDLSAEALRSTVSPSPAGGDSGPASPTAIPATPEVFAAPMFTLAQYRASGGSLPELNLELHVYSPTAAERFVFINSSKYEEGQTLAEGPRLGAITEDGAVLIHEGRSLLLPRE